MTPFVQSPHLELSKALVGTASCSVKMVVSHWKGYLCKYQFHFHFCREREIHQRSKPNYTSVHTKETLSPVRQWTNPKKMVRRLEVQRVNTPYSFLKSAPEQGVKPPLQLACVHATRFSWLTFQFV